MDVDLYGVGKEVAVEMVKLSQKKGMKGSKGDWKDFLNFYDRKIGSSLSDPSRRPVETLVAFLKTFDKPEDLKFLEKILECHNNREQVAQLLKASPDSESPEQRLVRLTLEHPQYPIDYSYPSYQEDWVVVKSGKKLKAMRSTKMVAVDCEMVLCRDGTEALVRVCVVDRNMKVKLNKLVNPNKEVEDYRTEITGITAKDLEGVTLPLSDIQISMKKILSHGTILIGHSLNNDLQALKMDHARVIDTSYLFMSGNGPSSRRRLSLSSLCKSVLGYELRETQASHNCLDDACAAMKLVLAKIERGIDLAFPLAVDNAPDGDLNKLLVHRIPVNVSSEDLLKVIPGDFAVEVKPDKRIKGGKYSALAIFKNQQGADEAFDSIEGNLDKDSHGRLQKEISFQLSKGITGSLCIRKMSNDSPAQVTSKKRSLEIDSISHNSKKLRTDSDCEKVEEALQTDNCASHMKEIERLKQELSRRDQEISSLNKIIVALTRKQGL